MEKHQNKDGRPNHIQLTVCDVPQWSILGSKLFKLYVNDIANVSSLLRFVLFADDTNIFCQVMMLRRLVRHYP